MKMFERLTEKEAPAQNKLLTPNEMHADGVWWSLCIHQKTLNSHWCHCHGKEILKNRCYEQITDITLIFLRDCHYCYFSFLQSLQIWVSRFKSHYRSYKRNADQSKGNC